MQLVKFVVSVTEVTSHGQIGTPTATEDVVLLLKGRVYDIAVVVVNVK